MTSPKRGRRLLLALAATAIAAMALGATGASAAEELAKWQQSTSTMRWQGALTVDTPATAPTSCTSLTATGTAAPGGSAWSISNAFYTSEKYPVLKASCAGGTQIMVYLKPPALLGAIYDTVSKSYSLIANFESAITFPSPYGNYEQIPFIVPFTNGAGGSSSTVNFSNTVIGESVYGDLTLTGNLTVDDGKGNPRTLTH